MKKTQPTNTPKEKPKQHFAFLDYDEEDLLNWGVAITPPPPRRSGTIRVRLVYKGRSKPMLLKTLGKNRRWTSQSNIVRVWGIEVMSEHILISIITLEIVCTITDFPL